MLPWEVWSMSAFGAEDRKEAGESGWAVVWKAGELIISGNAAGLLFFLTDYFLHALAFSSESAVRSVCVGGVSEVTDQKSL